MTPDELATVRNEYIGFVFQNFNLLPKRNILDNVMLPLMYRGLVMDDRIRRAREMLKLVGLEKFETYLPTQLSGGMKQRVAIARSIANRPEILLADEPTGNLDPKHAEFVFDLLLDLVRKNKMSMLFVTHDMNLAKRADRTITIIDGIVK